MSTGGFGLNSCVKSMVENAARQNVAMQRSALSNPVVTIKKKLHDSNVPAYLDNKEDYSVFEDIPVLPEQIRYRNQMGKVIVEDSYYFTFLPEDLSDNDPDFFIPEKDVIIIFESNQYVIAQREYDESANLIRIETKLV